MIQKMSDKLKDPEKRRQLKLLGIIMALLIIFVGLYAFVNNKCFIENVVLLDQSIQESDLCDDDECLFITVQPVGDQNDYKKTLYFANDTLTLREKRGFNNGDTLKLQWCDVGNKEFRIRGMDRVE